MHVRRWFALSTVSVAILVVTGPGNLLCQVPSVNNSATANTILPVEGGGHSTVDLLSETVDPATGSVNISINLPVPRSRGITVPFALQYSSSQLTQLDQVGLTTNLSWTRARGPMTSGGWSFTFPWASNYLFQYQISYTNGYATCSYDTDYVFTDTSGQTHNLGLGSATKSQPNSPCPNAPSQRTFGSDGQVGAIYSNTGAPVPGAINVYDLNGTTYKFYLSNSYYPSSIEDRNGNLLQVNSSSIAANPASLNVTDTAGRALLSATFQSGSGTPNNGVAVAGINYPVSWATVQSTFSVPSTRVTAQQPNVSCPTSIPDVNISQAGIHNLSLPNGQNYTFYYGGDNPDSAFNNSFGLISQIIYPDGGWVKYKWALSSAPSTLALFAGIEMQCVAGSGPGTSCYPTSLKDACGLTYATPVLIERQVSHDGTNIALDQTYQYATNFPSAGSDWTGKSTTIFENDLVSGQKTRHVLTYVPKSITPVQPYTASSVAQQTPVESTVQTFSDWTTASAIETKSETWADRFSLTGISETNAAGHTKSKTISYAIIGPGGGTPILYAPSEIDEYDYGATAPSRKTVYAYQPFSFAARYAAPCTKTVLDANGSVLFEQDSYFDGQTSLCAAYAGGAAVSGVANLVSGTHDENAYSSNATSRGNVTRSVVQGPGATPAGHSFTYDETGQVLSQTDPRGFVTTYGYADNYTSGGLQGNTNTYLTSVTLPSVNGSSHQMSYSYQLSTGALRSETDENGNTTKYVFNDPLNRPTQVSYADGGSTSTTYRDSQRAVDVSVALNSSGLTKQTTEIHDGIGHIVQRTLSSDPAGSTSVDSQFDGHGNLHYQSIPYRGSAQGGTTYTSDALGRTTQVSLPDGNVRTTCYDGVGGNSACSSSQAGSSWIDTLDEAGHKHRSISDGLGRLTAVMEPDQNGQLTRETDYVFDLLGNLTAVKQNGVSGETPRSRTFTYDGLSRLITSANPESGLICYGTWANSQCVNGYDGNGNLQAKTDARGTVTTYSYDALNRLTDRNYSDGTPGKHFQYDQTNVWMGQQYNTMGRVSRAYTDPDTRVFNGNAKPACSPQNSPTANANPGSGNPVYCNWTDELYSYDAVGRINRIGTASPSEAGWAAHETDLTYDLAGNIASLRYPDGRLVTQGWDGAGRLQNVIYDSANGQHIGYTFASALAYTPGGAQSEITLGNGVIIHNPYNNRQQICQTWVAGPNGWFYDKHYMYGDSSQWCANTPGNNGNIASILDMRNNNHSQGFGYDTLNRVNVFSNGDGSVQEAYNYDSFGNMNQSGTFSSSLTFDQNNRISTGAYGYDAAGNVVSFNNSVFLTNYAYDAESSLFRTDAGNSYYTYDANGNRMRKDASGGFTEYQYFNGQLLAEKNSSGHWSDHIYANGRRIARMDSTANALHSHGVRDSSINMNCGSVWNTSGAGGGNYTIRTGDRLYFRQRAILARGGITFYTSGSQGNQYINPSADDGMSIMEFVPPDSDWHARTASLDAYAGQKISYLVVPTQASTPAGTWDQWLEDVSIGNSDGTVTPILTAHSVSGSLWDPCGGHDFTFGTEQEPENKAVYFVSDHLATTALEVSANGAPLWYGEFAPFGQETDDSVTLNQYKYTGKERDSESGLDYFGARYYESSIGRWMSPDWAARPSPVPYANLQNPQTLNLYSYVGNNPLSQRDADGHVWDWLRKLGNLFTDAQCYCSGEAAARSTLSNRTKRVLEEAAYRARLRRFNRNPANRIFVTTMFVLSGNIEGLAGGIAGEATEGAAIEEGAMTEAGASEASFPDNASQIGHIFREDVGHVADTPENRALLESVANDPSAKLGPDQHGNMWSARTLDSGEQVWVQTRGTTIVNGGVNQSPMQYNPQTGLKRQ